MIADFLTAITDDFRVDSAFASCLLGARLAGLSVARHARGTIVETYLNKRSLPSPPEAAAEALRYEPDCPFGTEFTNCMVALVRDIHTNERRAIHKTALDRFGNKIHISGLDRMQKDRLAARGRSGLSWMSKRLITNGVASPSLRTRMDDKSHRADSIRILPSRIATGTTRSQPD